MRIERSFFFAAVIVGGICLLPVDVFVLVSLWPQRVLVSWLLLGLVALVLLVRLALWVIKAGTIAKVRLSEEALRPGRLYAHERLIEDEGRYNDERTAQQEQEMMNRPHKQRSFVYSPHRQEADPDDVRYSGLQPLNIDSYDWAEEN
ncbi:MAG TPA: hypothetical protein VF026_25265 [Ktedonobacteraceae bacterium]